MQDIAGPNCHIEGVEIPTQNFMLTCATFSDHLHSFEHSFDVDSSTSLSHLLDVHRDL